MGEEAETVDHGFRDSTLDDTAVLTKVTNVTVAIKTSSVADEATAVAMAAACEANPWDGWLPIKESRGSSTVSAVFHVLCSGMGIQALMLPVAFAPLGWVWGIIILSLGFLWQLYTIWALVQLHESAPGTRYSRFLHLSIAAFGPRLGKLLAIFPVMYLSGGTRVTMIITGGGAMELLFKTMCGRDGAVCSVKPRNGVEWFLLFTCIAIIIAQRLNLHSIATISLFGAITAVSYGALIWILSVAKGRPEGISYKPLIEAKSDTVRIGVVLNAIGINALSFRGHGLVLEIQPLVGFGPMEAKYQMVDSTLLSHFTLPFVLPCFMWLAIKRPRHRSGMWWLNVGLGWLGVVLWVVTVVAAIWVLVDRGINANFFHPLERLGKIYNKLVLLEESQPRKNWICQKKM